MLCPLFIFNDVKNLFLALKKHNTARQAMQMIPSDSIKTIHREWHAMVGISEYVMLNKNTCNDYFIA